MGGIKIANCTNIISDCKYNLSKIISEDAIDKPANWISNLNQLVDGWLVPIILVLIGATLFFYMRNNNQEDDVNAIAYSGFVTSLIGTMLCLVATDNGYKLISYSTLALFILATALAFGIKKANQRY